MKTWAPPLPAGTTVLIVEDHPLVALMAREMVESLGGCVVAVAATVAQGLAACRAGGFAVAMLDLDLDGRSSIPVARALTAGATPFLVTTGFDRLPDGFGHLPLLAKPYTMAALRRELTALLT